MSNQIDTRTDTVILIFSALAVLIAATLSLATISSHQEPITVESSDPLKRAERAATAGFEAARRHIECHGRISAGSLTPKYYVNGATYIVEWDDVDMTDSTVTVRAKGDFSWGNDKHHYVEMESKIKLDFLPSHKQEILEKYYSKQKAFNPIG